MDTLSPLVIVEGWTKDKDEPNNNKKSKGTPHSLGVGERGAPPK
jgi:hypothetical protein